MRAKIDVGTSDRLDALRNKKKHVEIIPAISENSRIAFNNVNYDQNYKKAIYDQFLSKKNYGKVESIEKDQRVVFYFDKYEAELSYINRDHSIGYCIREWDLPLDFSEDVVDFQIDKIEIVKYSDLDSRQDLTDYVGYSVKTLKSNLRKLLPGKYKIPMSNEALFYAISLSQIYPVAHGTTTAEKTR
jgi:hypothetical protein